jgi:hypothetical protein
MVVSCLSSGTVETAAELPRVILHLTEYEQVPPDELRDAQEQVDLAYRRIGVQIEWAAQPMGDMPRDGSLHVSVVILNDPMSAKYNADVNALGQGSHITKHAYIYYPRIVGYAQHTHSSTGRVLAVVMAHELGHVLLPEFSHVRSGLMQPTWQGRIVNVPPFLPAQASTIRELLTTGR